jgi:hypothetical protein
MVAKLLRVRDGMGLLTATIEVITNGQWTLRPCPIALAGPPRHEDDIVMALYICSPELANVDIAPPEMRIVVFRQESIHQRELPDTTAIANNRKYGPAIVAEGKRNSDIARLYDMLAARVNAAYAALDPTTNEHVVKLIDDTLNRLEGVKDKSLGLRHLLAAASLLGIFEEIFASALAES